MTERKTTRPDSIPFADPYQNQMPRPIDTYERSGQRGGKISCAPYEITPGETASDLATLVEGVTLPIDVSDNWGNLPTSYSITIDPGADVSITNDGTVFGSGSAGTYNNVKVCATNDCGETCTDEFTITITL